MAKRKRHEKKAERKRRRAQRKRERAERKAAKGKTRRADALTAKADRLDDRATELEGELAAGTAEGIDAAKNVLQDSGLYAVTVNWSFLEVTLLEFSSLTVQWRPFSPLRSSQYSNQKTDLPLTETSFPIQMDKNIRLRVGVYGVRDDGTNEQLDSVLTDKAA